MNESQWQLLLRVLYPALVAVVLTMAVLIWAFMGNYVHMYFTGRLGLGELLWQSIVPLFFVWFSALWVVRYRNFRRRQRALAEGTEEAND